MRECDNDVHSTHTGDGVMMLEQARVHNETKAENTGDGSKREARKLLKQVPTHLSGWLHPVPEP